MSEIQLPSAGGRMSLSPRTIRLAEILLLSLYILAGVVYSSLLPYGARYLDERDYMAFSQHLLHGPGFSLDGVHLSAARSPGYPFFLAMVEAIGGGIVAVRLVQYLLVAATILLVARLARARGLVSPLMVTILVWLYPILFYTSGTFYPQTLAAFLFVGALAQLITPSRSADPGGADFWSHHAHRAVLRLDF